MKLEYIEQNGDTHMIDTENCTQEELERFAFEDVYDYTEVTSWENDKLSIGDIAFSYATDKYKDVLDKEVLTKIIDDVEGTLILNNEEAKKTLS